MPYRRLPNTIAAVIRTLKTARDEWKNTPTPANRAISAEHWAQLDDAAPASLLNRLLSEASDVDLALAAQGPVTDNLSRTADLLAMFVSHFHQVLDLGITREYFKSGARSYYGRDLAATTIPDLSSYDAIAEAAEAVVTGEARRQQAEGAQYQPMQLPSAGEVDDLRQQFLGLRSQSDQALVNTDRQREELQAVYAEAQALAVDICDTVEFFYRKDPDAASRRAKCERWGVVYVADAEPAPAPTA
jgi:hypothetical protein